MRSNTKQVLLRHWAPAVAAGLTVGQAHAGVIFTVRNGGPSGLQGDVFYTNIDTCFTRASGVGGGPGSGLGLGGDEIDGVSKAADDDEFVICWSVDPASEGSAVALFTARMFGPGIPTFRVNDQHANNQAAGDTFVSTEAFNAGGVIPPLSLGLNSNRLATNQGGLYIHDFDLLPNVNPNVLVPSGTPLDDVDGETHVPDPCFPPLLYFSLSGSSPSLLNLPGVPSGASIYGDPDINIAGDEFFFAGPLALGLTGLDDIDGITVRSSGAPGVLFDPAIDYVLFSLAPGSPSLPLYGASPADVFIVDNLGTRVLAQAGQLGLRGIDNIDSVETIRLDVDVAQTLLNRVFTDPCPADINNDGVVDLVDLAALLFAFGSADNPRYSFGDTNGDGVVDLMDLSIVLFNFGMVCPPDLPPPK
ncbi:MAG: hypothetical protein KDA20_04225 [Phycisphaerales bacterium]|nr:hypothetical protein [Phycisphaerales bacterium]